MAKDGKNKPDINNHYAVPHVPLSPPAHTGLNLLRMHASVYLFAQVQLSFLLLGAH
jgi:hypothetical protein